MLVGRAWLAELTVALTCLASRALNSCATIVKACPSTVTGKAMATRATDMVTLAANFPNPVTGYMSP